MALELVVVRQRDVAAVEGCRLVSTCGLHDEGSRRPLTALHSAQQRPGGMCHAAAQSRVKLAGATATAWTVFDRLRASASGFESAVVARALLPPDFRDRASIEGVKPDWAAVDEELAQWDEPGETRMTDRV